MFKALFKVFVLAVVLESALAVIFNWRPFLAYFDGRGLRTIISLAFAWVIASILKLDLVSELHRATTGSVSSALHGVGTFLTALVLAGGSSGVNNIMKSLGFRDAARPETVVPKPPHNSAWIAVRLQRQEAVGSVRVLLQRGANPFELVGMIGPGRTPAPLLRWILRDPTRFPMSAGLAIDGGDNYSFRLEGEDSDMALKVATWGPYPIARGAIIDIDLRL